MDRTIATIRCRWCLLPIGYETDYYQVGNWFAHAICEETEIEMENQNEPEA